MIGGVVACSLFLVFSLLSKHHPSRSTTMACSYHVRSFTFHVVLSYSPYYCYDNDSIPYTVYHYPLRTTTTTTAAASYYYDIVVIGEVDMYRYS